MIEYEIEYEGVLKQLKRDLDYWEHKEKEATNDIDEEIAMNAQENIKLNINMIKEAMAFREIKRQKELHYEWVYVEGEEHLMLDYITFGSAVAELIDNHESK